MRLVLLASTRYNGDVHFGRTVHTSTAQKMELNDEIMFAVFEKFLQYPPDSLLKDDAYTREYFDSFVVALPFDDKILVRWHVAILFDEFILDHGILKNIFGRWCPFEKPADYLNRKGREFYNALKNPPQE